MLYAGLDLASQESFLHVMDCRGEKVSSCRVPMTKEAVHKAFKPFVSKGVCVAIEAGGVTRWVHDYLYELGVREVHVANPTNLA